MQPFTDSEANGKNMKYSDRSKKESCLLVATVILSFLLLAFLIAVIVLALAFSKVKVEDSKDADGKDSSLALSDVCTTHGCLATAIDLLDSMNASVDPCNDFYQFSCGKWVATVTGPTLMKMGNIGRKQVTELSKNVIAAAEETAFPSDVRKIANAYIVCGKYGEMTEKDKAWLLQILQEVGGWPMTNKDWNEKRYHWERNLATAIQRLSINAPMAVGIDVNIFDTTKNSIQMIQPSLDALQSVDKDKTLYVAKALGNRGEDPSLESEYEELQEFMDALKNMSRPQNDLINDPSETKEITIRDLKRDIQWINWLEFFNTTLGPYIGTPHESEPVIVIGLTYITKALEMAFTGKVSKRTLANYIAANFIQSLYKVNSKIAGTSELLNTEHKIKKMLKDTPAEGLSETCLDFYAEKASPAIDFISYVYRTEKLMNDEMILDILASMKIVIEESDWLDASTKSAALEKLGAMEHFSGYPKRHTDTKKVIELLAGLPNMTDNPMKNQLEVEYFLAKKIGERFRDKVDRSIWPMAVGGHGTSFNAFYVPEANAVVIPAGIQMDPILSPSRPVFWNYGGFGSILGHEVSHGFDTSGSRRDKHGNIKNWWKPRANEEFEKRSQCFIEQYDKFSFGGNDTSMHVNGANTVGENVADNGGLHQSFMAYKRWEKNNGKEKLLPGLEKYDTHQLFFISAAQPYCSIKLPPEYLHMVYANDEHSPTQFRTVGAVTNSKDFADAFKCKPGSPMNPQKKCVIW